MVVVVVVVGGVVVVVAVLVLVLESVPISETVSASGLSLVM